MSLTVTHAKVSAIADDPAASAAGEVLPSDWNAAHVVTGAMSVFNAADFGAVGDGVSDDTVEIQAALNAANDAGGGVVWIPPGTYKISNSLIVYSKTNVLGAGRGATTLRGTAGAYAGVTVNGGLIYCTIAMVSADNASVRSITVDHVTNGATVNGIGILHDGAGTPSTGCVIEDCQVLGHISHQYLIWNYKGIDSKIINNYVDGGSTTRDGTTGQEGIESYGGIGALIAGNTVKNIEQNGIYVWGDATSGYPTNLLIANNTVNGCFNGVRVSAPAYNVRITNNHLKSNWEAGVKVTCSAGEVLDDVALVGNSIETSDIGVYAPCETGSVCRRLLIDGNSIGDTDNATGGAMQLHGVSNCIVSNNHIRDASANGIYVQDSSNLQVSGNIINTVDYCGIIFIDVSKGGVLDNMLLEFNHGSTSSSGVKMISSNNVLIDGNALNWTNEAYPIYVTSSSSNRCIIGNGNRLLRNSYYNPTYRNDGTNPNRSTVTANAGATTTTVYNTLVNPSSQIRVRQSAGPALLILVNNIDHGSFDIVHAAAAGTETFAYEIA